MTAPALRLGRSRRERVLPWALLALALAVVGLVGQLWRPLAPPVGAVDTDLHTFSAEVMAAVETYRAPRYVAAATSTALGVLVPVLIVLTRRGRRLVAAVAGAAPHAPLRAALVAVVVSVVGSLATLPLSAWLRVLHDGRWGFRTQPWWGWAIDWVTVSAGTWLTMAALVVVLFAAVRRWPRSWPYRLTVVGAVLGAIVVALHPLVLQPVLLPTAPMPEGETRDAAEELLAGMGADLPLYVGEASLRTTRANALVTGLGPTERVVVYDTMLELPEEQVRSVLAHELAHWEHRDLLRGVLAVPTAMLPALLLLRATVWSSGARRRIHARGPTDPRLAAVVLATAVVLELVGAPVVNAASRRAEAAADHRAIEVTGEAGTQIAAARAFTVRDLSAPRPPRWAQILYGTHPPVAERIRAAAAQAEELPTLEELQRVEADIAHPRVGQDPP